jgi:hypothetical protein
MEEEGPGEGEGGARQRRTEWCGMRDAGCGMRDAGCGMRDVGPDRRREAYLPGVCSCAVEPPWQEAQLAKSGPVLAVDGALDECLACSRRVPLGLGLLGMHRGFPWFVSVLVH